MEAASLEDTRLTILVMYLMYPIERDSEKYVNNLFL